MKEESIKTYVIDASFVLAMLLPDEDEVETSEMEENYKNGTVNFSAPTLLQFEVINGIKSAVKRKRIDLAFSHILIEDFLKITIAYEDIQLKKLIDLAIAKDLSVYDASYVLLARSKHFPLLTFDKRLQKLAR